MALPNAYAQYGTGKIMTASPAELTLLLYEGAIKFCNLAITAVEQQAIPKAHTNIMKAERIVDYLRGTLDMKYPVAQDFDRIYDYLSLRLRQANVKKDQEVLEEVCGHFRGLRDTWKQVIHSK
ncbi:MAG: flagellar export chaperone FliS [Clostridium sp.]|jgi:flagellar protein FliS|nr:flagellar export chaperone FliS [Clostridium sp.]